MSNVGNKEEYKLTDKQRLFITEYLIDFNQTQAAIRAGYSEKTARSIACEMLTKPYIRNEIEKHVNNALDNNKRTLKIEIIKELKEIGFSKDKKVRLTERLKALEMLGKYMTMFTDRQEIELKGNLKKVQFEFVNDKATK